MADQELAVNITGDVSGLTKATADAARQLDKLQKEVQDLDSETVEVTPELELSRIQRDMANLNKALDGIERRKATPEADLDVTQLLRDEAKVRKALDELDSRRIEIEGSVNVTGMASLRATLDDLSSSVPMLGRFAGMATKAGAAAGTVGVAVGGWQLGTMAADVETTTLQLGALTGSAEEGAAAFEQLQAFAAATPFELDQVTTAARSLVAAGKDMSVVPDMLTDLGNVAAATGAPLEEIALVFQQMLTKGKVSNEELLQLAERGVPAYQALADSLGVPVEQVSKLAEQGKIGAQSIDDLAVALGDMYPTAMDDQAESFNGQMSTLSDTTKQVGQNLGQLMLPAMKDTVGAMQQLADWTGQASSALTELREESENPGGLDDDDSWLMKLGKGLLAVGTWEPDATNTDKIRKEVDALKAEEQAAAETADALDPLAREQRRAATEAAAAADAAEREAASAAQVAEAMGLLTADVREATLAHTELVDAFTASNSVMSDARSSVYDYEGALDELTASLKEGSGFAPSSEQGRANWQALVRVAETASDRIQSTLETRGAKAAQAVYQSSRQAMADLLRQAGVKAPQAWQLVNQVLKRPHQINIELDKVGVAKVEATLARLRRKRTKLITELAPDPSDPATFKSHMAELQSQLKPLDAKIKAQTEGLNAAKDDLAGVAKPGGNDREAVYQLKVDSASKAAADAELDNVADNRYATVFVSTVKLGGGGGGGGAGPGAQGALVPGTAGLLAAATTLGAQPAGLQFVAAGRSVGIPSMQRGGQPTTELAPRQTPIKVYLDGAEIADHLELKARRMATSTAVSARRLA